jgi:hypothetical protein
MTLFTFWPETVLLAAIGLKLSSLYSFSGDETKRGEIQETLYDVMD